MAGPLEGLVTHKFVQTNGIKMHYVEAGSGLSLPDESVASVVEMGKVYISSRKFSSIELGLTLKDSLGYTGAYNHQRFSAQLKHANHRDRSSLFGPTVLFLHGFPDFWYSWRHQIPAFVAAGYRVVVPDHRGVGETEVPDSVDKYTELHNVGDVVGLLDSLELKQVLVVAHDWGVRYGALLALFRPDRVRALALLGAGHRPRVQEVDIVDSFRTKWGNDMYISVFQAPGVAEALFKKAKNEDVLSAFFLRWNSTPNLTVPRFIANEPLPDWLTKEELKICAEAFDKSGWTGALSHYRAMKLSWELTTPWTKASFPVQVPVMITMGRQDIMAAFLGIKSAKDEEQFFAKCKQTIPGLKVQSFIDASHFLHQEKSKEVNKLLLDFLEEFKN